MKIASAVLYVALIAFTVAISHCKKNDRWTHTRLKEAFSYIPACTLNGQYIPEAEIFYRTQGTFNKHRPTIIFSHIAEASHRTFLSNQSYLSDYYFTVSFDLRGRGDSSKTDPAAFHYTNQALAYDMHTLLVNLEVTGPLIFVGTISGALVFLKYLELYNNPLNKLYDTCRLATKLIFINGGPGLIMVDDCAAAHNCQPSQQCKLCWPNASLTRSAFNEGTKPLLEKDFAAATCVFASFAFGERCTEKVNLAKQALAQDFLKSSAAITESLFYHAFSEDLRHVVHSIKLPTLITYGLLSAPPVGNSLYLHEHIPGSKLVEFKNSGEQPNLTAYKTFNKILHDFIKGNDLPEYTIIDEPCCVCPLYKPTTSARCISN